MKYALSAVESLSKQHDLSQFDCGEHESLNLWLKRFALQNQNNETARTYVVNRESGVVGYENWPDGVKGHFLARVPPEGFVWDAL